jgi:hypothetical protein
MKGLIKEANHMKNEITIIGQGRVIKSIIV